MEKEFYISKMITPPTSGSPLIISDDEIGDYKVSVQAFNEDTFLFLTSGLSNVLAYDVYQLDTPTITYGAGSVISWGPISNANDYDVYLNYNYYDDTGTIHADFNPLVKEVLLHM